MSDLVKNNKSKLNLMLRKRGGFDELYTPDYAISVLKPYIKLNSKILAPFDDFSSNYKKSVRRNRWCGSSYYTSVRW